MIRFILVRVLTAVPTLLVVITVTFFLMRLAPGGPFDSGAPISSEIRQNLERAYLLDRPLPEQYLNYLANLLQGDFGPSFTNKDLTVGELINAGYGVSFTLGLLAMAVALLIGIPAGLYAGARQNRAGDRAMMLLVSAGMVVPSFVVAPLLALVFGVLLRWLPVAGWGRPEHLVLPVLALAIPYAAYVARLMRAGTVECLSANFVRTARAKGLSERTVLLRHVLPSAILPVVSFLSPALTGLVVTSVVVERIFGLPGLGRYMIEGALNRDYTLVMGLVVLYAAVLLVLNLAADILLRKLDPRIGWGGAG